MNHRLDQYLWNIENYLSALPNADRKKEVWEIRQHLTVLVTAGEAGGQTTDAATRAAIAQFGASREIGSRLRYVERRKRFGLLVDVFLFCAVIEDVSDLTTWGMAALWQTYSPLPAEVKDWATFGGPPYWGLAALVLLFLRHGVKRGAGRKMRGSASPVGVAVGFFVLEMLVIHSWNVVAFYVSRAHPVSKMGGWETAHLVWHHFGLCWLAAYGAGRFSRCQVSVADAVGTAAAFVPVAGLLTVTVEYMPSLAAFAQNPVGYLMAVGLWIVPGTLFVLLARFGVHVGEKSRRAVMSAFDEGNYYEPAI